MSCSGIVAGNTSEYECCPLRFCLLRNTPHSGKIGGTRSSALLLFSSEQNPMDARLFQALLTFSPVSGVLPRPIPLEIIINTYIFGQHFDQVTRICSKLVDAAAVCFPACG